MPTADIVNQWFREKLACPPLSRDTPAYNQVFAALPDLIARLEAAEPEAGAEVAETGAGKPAAAAADRKSVPQPAADAAPDKE